MCRAQARRYGCPNSAKMDYVEPKSDSCKLMPRRKLLKRILRAGIVTPLVIRGIGSVGGMAMVQKAMPSHSPPPPLALSPEDDLFLEEVERATFAYFWEQANPKTGLVKDRCNVRDADHSVVSSIAATGFGLTALCIGDKRHFVHFYEARRRAINTLLFLWEKLPQHRGFFYHFADVNTGERMWNSEASSIDTAILLCGVLTCRQYFQDEEISNLARAIFNRVEWTWLSMDSPLLSHGWMPKSGFLPYRWDYYSELMMMYLLGLGSSSYPLPKESWDAWRRVPFDYEGLRYIGSFAPLFVNQYSQAWFDFRGKRDKYADYFQNSVTATEVHRRFCMELGKQFSDYSDELWGITASDSEDHGYVVWGGPPEIGPIDGTVVPCAAGGSLPFLPQETLRVLRNIRVRYGADAWSKYGFVDAFNPLKGWYDKDVIGIDAGITLLMAENLRTGFVWGTFMKNPEARRGLERAGFNPYKAPGTNGADLWPPPNASNR